MGEGWVNLNRACEKCAPHPCICHAPQIGVLELEKNPYAITNHTFLHSGEHFFEFEASNEFAGVEASPVRGPHWLGEVH